MIQAVILQAQSTTGAIFEIAGLLIVAGIIAWLTSYYYYRSIYRKKLAEKDGIIREKDDRINQLETENRSLANDNKSKDQEIETLKKELEKARTENGKIRGSGDKVV